MAFFVLGPQIPSSTRNPLSENLFFARNPSPTGAVSSITSVPPGTSCCVRNPPPPSLIGLAVAEQTRPCCQQWKLGIAPSSVDGSPKPPSLTRRSTHLHFSPASISSQLLRSHRDDQSTVDRACLRRTPGLVCLLHQDSSYSPATPLAVASTMATRAPPLRANSRSVLPLGIDRECPESGTVISFRKQRLFSAP